MTTARLRGRGFWDDLAVVRALWHIHAMTAVLHTHLPDDMRAARSLPGIQPERGPWLRVDEAYAAQMQRRLEVMRDHAGEVLYLEPEARPAALELLEHVVALLPSLGFEVAGDRVQCPDGRGVDLDPDAPMATLGRLCQNDFVLMEQRRAEHVLTGAVLCFPASWRLLEKAGRPLTGIHVPVDEYDDDVARRVQRLFDGIQVGRPLWRFNQLWYQDPELYQPRSRTEPRRVGAGSRDGPFYRTERQTLVRLPQSRAVVFAIHTLVLARGDVPPLA
ncbi:heme-dependent oxidative N-demethylase family protein [Tateyamaria sp. SN6-1]|uniref:heme-dependent oxidative N-demethylase family protein n=1 Tax=Tateyamaria sp. SN6-1 TaxID=3092148 RepID=UPI0039F498D1